LSAFAACAIASRPDRISEEDRPPADVVTERIRLRDINHLQIDTVVDDPLALKAAWRYIRIDERSRGGSLKE